MYIRKNKMATDILYSNKKCYSYPGNDVICPLCWKHKSLVKDVLQKTSSNCMKV